MMLARYYEIITRSCTLELGESNAHYSRLSLIVQGPWKAIAQNHVRDVERRYVSCTLLIIPSKVINIAPNPIPHIQNHLIISPKPYPRTQELQPLPWAPGSAPHSQKT